MVEVFGGGRTKISYYTGPEIRFIYIEQLSWNPFKVIRFLLSISDPFIKVYLLQDGRKISKKKTATKRDDPNPVFNEAMIFSVPAIVLQVIAPWPKGICE